MHRSSPVAAWRDQKITYLLHGVQCDGCKTTFYPRKYRCHCGLTSFRPFQFSGDGVLVSFTQITIPTAEFAACAPYCIGIVRLKEGPHILTQLTDVQLEDLYVGMVLTSTFRKYYTAGEAGLIFYGIKCMPKKVG